jgi:hypothetical protein
LTKRLRLNCFAVALPPTGLRVAAHGFCEFERIHGQVRLQFGTRV